MFPSTINKDTKSDAERKVFEIFETKLSTQYSVFHSVAWIGRMSSGLACDGEADFIVSHPELGVLVIEVKGGRISYDGKNGKWYTKDRYGIDHELSRSPMIQATESHHNLYKKLQEVPTTSRFNFPLFHAVCFPDGVVDQDFGIGAPKELIIDGQDLVDPEKAILRVFHYWVKNYQIEGPGDKGIDALIELLAPKVEIRSLLSIQFEDEEQQIKKLTQQQFKVLDGLSRMRHALIMGCAGSGKTMLALEKARRLAYEGYAVLFTCYNARLSEWIQSTGYNQPGITITNFHKLCVDWAQKAGLHIPKLDSEGVDGDEEFYFNELLPQLLIDAVKIRKPSYNALIVDEGQDFAENWWIALESMLVERESNIYYIFADNNQNIYSRSELGYPFKEPIYLLTENCRNTQKIHKLFHRYYNGTTDITCNGPEGRTPEYQVLPDDKGLIEVIRKTLHILINQEKVKPQDIIVLTPLSKRTSSIKEGTKLGNLTITWEPNCALGKIECCTIHSFKGLERPVVILAEINASPANDRGKLAYIATSRARNHLIILGNLP